MDATKYTWVLIIGLCWMWLPVSAQQPAVSAATTEKIRLQGHFSLVQLTETVYRQTGMGFSFNAQKIKGTKEMTFAAGTYTLQQVLQKIHTTGGLNYVIRGDHIILYEPPIPVKTTTIVAVKKKQPVVAPVKKPLEQVPAFPTIPLSESEIIIIKAAEDSLFSSPAISLSGIPVSISNGVKSIVVPSQITPAAKQIEVPGKNLFSEGIYVTGGLFTTDVLYANVGLEAGKSWLHVLASYGKNNNIHEWRVGLGSIVKRTPHASWEANASVGFMQRTYIADSGELIKNVKVKGQLADLQLAWWHVFNKRLATKVALNYHFLFSTYYIDEEKLPLNRVFRADYDNVYSLMKPWHLISNTFDPAKATNLRQWIGGTIGIYYRIF